MFEFSCAVNKTTSNQAIRIDYKIKNDYPSFEITNISQKQILFPSPDYLYIEVKNDQEWQKIPYVPCECGTPCAKKLSKRIHPEEQLWTEWKMISRKCKGRETETKRYGSGMYRIKFSYQILEGEYISKSDKIWVEFEVKL